jgi:hypothetical protein
MGPKFAKTAAQAVEGTGLQLQSFPAGWHAETATHHVVIGGNAEGLTRISVLFEPKRDGGTGFDSAIRILKNVIPDSDDAAAAFRAALNGAAAGKLDVLIRVNGQRAWLSLEPKSGWPLLTMTPS